MSLELRSLRPEDSLWAAPLLAASGRDCCEYSFTTAYMWSEHYDVRIARVGEVLVLGSERSYLTPVGNGWEEVLRQLYDESPRPLRLHSVDEALLTRLKALFPGRVHAEEARDDFDYLYRTEDLANLPGKVYHGKKNHISAFSRAHEWTYEPLSAENVDDMVRLSREWCEEKGSCTGSLNDEQCAIRRVLREPERFSLSGGLIRVEGRAVAFTLGSPINERVFDIHVEKALSAFSGAYAVINREFAKTLTAYEYLNRENDMGIPGLRRAKESYRPAILLKKYLVTIQ
ncbi:MAG: DUF2156 domain-containing protein [Clostridia bacterium]|nr:DUF2156 domain-containing protein [Clostridia bacterium]